MRITGGEMAGRRLAVPAGEVRPTSDRVRESLFAILGDLTDRVVVDLFAGSGSLGFEALSRGATSATFVDRSPGAIAQIRATARLLGVDPRVRTLRAEATAALRRLAKAETAFDLVFLDPPYASGLADTTLDAVVRSGILGATGQVVIETDRRHPPATVVGLAPEDQRTYGDTLISFFRAAAATAADSTED